VAGEGNAPNQLQIALSKVLSRNRIYGEIRGEIHDAPSNTGRIGHGGIILK
jgi:hypothetical protein